MSSMTSPPIHPATACAGHRVGVIALDERGRIRLAVDAAGGLAPLSAHIDTAQPDPRRAALAQTAAAGLTVTAMVQVADGHRADRCHRGDGPDGRPGHQWSVYRARTLPDRPDPDADAGDGVRWADPVMVRALAARAIAHAHGELPTGAGPDEPALAAVWIQWLQTAGLLTVPRHALAAIEDALTADPRVVTR